MADQLAPGSEEWYEDRSLPPLDTRQWRAQHIIGKGTDGAARLWCSVDAQEHIVDMLVEKLVVNSFNDPHLWTNGVTGPTQGSETKEMEALRILGTPQTRVFPRLLGTRVDRVRSVVHIYQEYCNAEDFWEIIQEYRDNQFGHTVIPEKFIWFCFRQLAQACLEMETSTRAREGARRRADEVIVHTDLKPNNVFAMAPERYQTGNFSGFPSLRMGDFGRAEITYRSDPNNPDKFTHFYHSQGYTPAEMWFALDEIHLADRENRTAVMSEIQEFDNQQAMQVKIGSWTNIYQIGILIFCLMETEPRPPQPPFFDTYMQEVVVDTARTTQFYGAPLRNLVQRCLNWMPGRRPSPQALLDAINHEVASRGLDQVNPEEEIILFRPPEFYRGFNLAALYEFG